MPSMLEIVQALYRRDFRVYHLDCDIYKVRGGYLLGANKVSEPELPDAARLVANGDLGPPIDIGGYRHYPVF
jgi:hypothetical protein